MREPDGRQARLGALSEGHLGLFTFRQALEVGYPRSTIARYARTGRWIRVLPGVYRPAGVPPLPNADHVAAWLACGEPSAVSKLSAAAVWGLDAPPPDTPTVTVPIARRVRPTGVHVVRTRRWSAREMVERGRVRVTSPMRTLLDLAADLDELPLEIVLDDAHRRRLVRLEPLDRYARQAAAKGVRGASRLVGLVAIRDPRRPTDSGGETILRHRLRRSALPLPVPRHWIRTRAGRRRIDLAYPDQRVAIELDSYRWHEGRTAFDDDRVRDNELADAGWERRHITTAMLDDPVPTVELTIATALGLRPRGWRPG